MRGHLAIMLYGVANVLSGAGQKSLKTTTDLAKLLLLHSVTLLDLPLKYRAQALPLVPKEQDAPVIAFLRSVMAAVIPCIAEVTVSQSTSHDLGCCQGAHLLDRQYFAILPLTQGKVQLVDLLDGKFCWFCADVALLCCSLALSVVCSSSVSQAADNHCKQEEYVFSFLPFAVLLCLWSGFFLISSVGSANDLGLSPESAKVTLAAHITHTCMERGKEKKEKERTRRLNIEPCTQLLDGLWSTVGKVSGQKTGKLYPFFSSKHNYPQSVAAVEKVSLLIAVHTICAALLLTRCVVLQSHPGYVAKLEGDLIRRVNRDGLIWPEAKYTIKDAPKRSYLKSFISGAHLPLPSSPSLCPSVHAHSCLMCLYLPVRSTGAGGDHGQ